jgi:putative intracellular protease/amidase
MDTASPPAWWRDLAETMPYALKKLRVGIYGSGGAPFHHAALIALWGGRPVPVRAEAIHAGILEQLDVLIFPGGGKQAMAGMLTPLGTQGAELVRNWVADGGMYLGSCAGSFLPAAVGEGFWHAHPEARQLFMVNTPLANGSDSAFAGLTSPGVGTLEVAVTDSYHWLTRGLPERFELVHYNGPLFDVHTPAHAQLPSTLPTATYGVIRPVAVTDAFTASEAFLDKAPEVTLIGQCMARQAHNGVAAQYGSGTVVLFGSHPEFGFSSLQLGWGPGVRLLANALTYQAQKRIWEAEASANRVHGSEQATLACTLRDTCAVLRQSAQHFHKLRQIATGRWLSKDHAPGFLGKNAAQLWHEGLAEASEITEKTAAILQTLLDEGTPLTAAALWLDNPPLPNQDVGFMGLQQLANCIHEMLTEAQHALTTDPIPLAHAYDALDKHPYHLATGSYLSAAGLSAAALLCATVITTLVAYPQLAPLKELIQYTNGERFSEQRTPP